VRGRGHGVDEGGNLGLTLNEVKTLLKNAVRSASMSSATRSDLTVAKQTANGI
jgi:hypothetical protein